MSRTLGRAVEGEEDEKEDADGEDESDKEV
jgi:hypothetical protein